MPKECSYHPSDLVLRRFFSKSEPLVGGPTILQAQKKPANKLNRPKKSPTTIKFPIEKGSLKIGTTDLWDPNEIGTRPNDPLPVKDHRNTLPCKVNHQNIN